MQFSNLLYNRREYVLNVIVKLKEPLMELEQKYNVNTQQFSLII